MNNFRYFYILKRTTSPCLIANSDETYFDYYSKDDAGQLSISLFEVLKPNEVLLIRSVQ